MNPDIESIVSLLYDGVTCSGDWYDALDALRDAVGGAMFHTFVLSDASGEVLQSLASFEAPPSKVREYEQELAGDDPRMPLVLDTEPGRVMLDHEHIDARTMSRNPIYADWLAAVGLRFTLGMQLRAGEGEREILGVMRERGAPPFDARAKALCEQLSPHLSRASALRARMSRLAMDAALGCAALDRMPQGVAVVDAQGRLQHANAAAHGHLSMASGCRTRHGRLVFDSAEAQARFERLLAGACPAAGTLATGGALLARRAGGTLTVSVLPLKPEHPLVSMQQRPLALVVLGTPDGGQPVEPAVLIELFGLTRTEARMALALAEGQTVQEFAFAQNCSEHTARTHLRNLLRKSGCHRQVELVRLVQSLRLG